MKVKSLLNAVINRCNRGVLRFRLICQYKLGLLKNYQPDPFSGGKEARSIGRDCSDRFDAFSKFLPGEPFSFVDLGCNTGYFVFQLSKWNSFGVGIDIGRNEIMVCQSLAALHRVHNVAFARLRLTPDSVSSLPKFDVVIFLSVFHHFVRHFGAESAKNMLSVIASKTNRLLIFETGQPDEATAWAEELAFMGSDCVEWMEKTLRSAGFSNVYRLGQFSTSVSDVKRHLIVGEKLT